MIEKRKLVKTLVVFLVVSLLVISSSFFVACTRGGQRGRAFEVDGWNLWQFSRSRQINVVALMDDSLVVDGVLTIPTRVGRYNITSFGGTYYGFVVGLEARKIVIPPEIVVNFTFWMMSSGRWEDRPSGVGRDQIPHNVRYVELLCESFENINELGSWAVSSLVSNDGSIIYLSDAGTVIIPNGSSRNFSVKLISLNLSPERFNFIEKSQWLKTQGENNL